MVNGEKCRLCSGPDMVMFISAQYPNPFINVLHFTLIIANISHLFQLGKEKRWHDKQASAAAAVKGLLKFKIRPMEMCPSGCCRGKSGLLAYSVSSIYISTVSGIWSIYSLGYLHNIWWTADTGSGQGDLVHALSDNLHPSWLLVSNGLCQSPKHTTYFKSYYL